MIMMLNSIGLISIHSTRRGKILRGLDDGMWTGHVNGDAIVKGLSNYNSTMVVEPREVGGIAEKL